MSSEPRYGIRLKSLRRYHYRGTLYKRGNVYGVSRELRDYLVGTTHFVDQVVEPTAVDPKPMAEGEAAPANDMSRGSITGHGKTRSFGKTVEV